MILGPSPFSFVTWVVRRKKISNGIPFFLELEFPRSIASPISHYLRNLRFVPSSLQTKGNADGSFCSGRLESSKDAEKGSGGLVIAWTHPEIQRISLPRSSSALSLFTLPVMFDAIPDNFNGGHLSSSGDFSFAIIFSVDFFACKRWPSR